MVTEAINRKALIESTLVIALGFVAMVEGLRLIIYKDPYVLYDPIGPGYYILALSVGLLIVGVVHFGANCRRGRVIEHGTATSREMKTQLFCSIIILPIYFFLITFVGYPAATAVFFLLQLWASGVRSWRTNILFALIFTVVYYVVFVHLCEMVFPRGMVFD